MNRYILIAAVVTLATAATITLTANDELPANYATSETEDVINRLVEAHGGLDKWKNATTIAFDNVMYNPFAQSEAEKWWVSREVIDQKTRRAYQYWQIDDAVLVYDGEETWTTNWNRGNPPKMMVHFFYYFTSLPWLTQDDNVHLGEPGKGSLPGFDKEYVTIDMSFTEKPGVGKTERDLFKLYIDPDTYMLQGYEYSLGYGALLDLMGVPEGELFGPMLRVHDAFTDVDGLLFPAQFHTMPTDGSTTYGNHVILNYSLTEPFDESRVAKPADAVVDMSSDRHGVSK